MFGEYLIRRGLIDQIQLEAALSYQASYKKPIGEILAEFGYIDENNLDHYLRDFLSHKADDLISDQSLWATD
jgi:hypothetical protein